METPRLIEQARDGDRTAWERLAARMRDPVRRTAARYAGLTGTDRADLEQEMWLGILLALPHADPAAGDPLRYLLLSGRWRLLGAIRRSHRAAQLLRAVPPPGPAPSPEEEIATRWQTRMLEDRLRPPQRAVLRALLRGLRQDEVARDLGCSPANVCYHVRKIREGYRSLQQEAAPPARTVSSPPGPPG